MKSSYRFVIAAAVVLSGWALVPFVALPNQAIGWELFADAYNAIFSDGFESGDTTAWSRTVPSGADMVFYEANDEYRFRAWFRGDGRILAENPDTAVTVLVGLSGSGIAVFSVEARLADGLVSLRARAHRDDGSWAETPWRAIDERPEFIEVEWRRAQAASRDGELFVVVDDRLLLWLVDLANHAEALESVGILYFEGDPVLVDVTEAVANR